MVTMIEALTAGCPTCRVRPGRPCVYIDNHPEVFHRSARQKEVGAKVGEPTARPHNSRYHAFAARQRRSALAPITGLSADRRALHAALTTYDKREYFALKTWLNANCKILIPEGSHEG